jgi:hypothetical protein
MSIASTSSRVRYFISLTTSNEGNPRPFFEDIKPSCSNASAPALKTVLKIFPYFPTFVNHISRRRVALDRVLLSEDAVSWFLFEKNRV